jgi:hypothetical protein
MNRDAGDLREFFLYAIFESDGDVVDLGDGQASIHGAVAGDEDFVFHLAHQEGSQRLVALRGRIALCIITSKHTHLGR